jgi:hypothetical protein
MAAQLTLHIDVKKKTHSVDSGTLNLRPYFCKLRWNLRSEMEKQEKLPRDVLSHKGQGNICRTCASTKWNMMELNNSFVNFKDIVLMNDSNTQQKYIWCTDPILDLKWPQSFNWIRMNRMRQSFNWTTSYSEPLTISLMSKTWKCTSTNKLRNFSRRLHNIYSNNPHHIACRAPGFVTCSGLMNRSRGVVLGFVSYTVDIS